MGESNRLRQNYVTNHYALNMSQLAEATKIAGSQAAQSGIGIDEMTAALATMISTTQQGGEIASRALRGILMNIQQVKGEVGDGEEDITAESLSKYEKAAEALGVSLKEVRNGAVALRDPMVVLNELAIAYNKEADDSIKKANLISAIGGKYRGNQLSALLANWDTYKDILETYRSEDAIGSATEEAAKSANNWMGTLNQLKNAWTELVNEVVNSDAIIEILNLVKEGLLDIKKSGILEYVGNLVTVATKLLKPIKTIHDTFSKYTYGGMFKGLSMFADWLNRDKIEAEKAKQAIEEEQKLRESAISNIQAYGDESQAIGDLVGQYVKLVSSNKDVAEIKDGLASIQDQIIEKYGLEAGAIDLVNDKLSKNIELLVEQEKERNNAWLRENNENIQVAEDFFNQEHDAYDLLSFHGEEDSLKKSFGAARIEASKYFEYLKEEFKKAGISELIQENFGFSQDSFTYGFSLKEGLAPEQQVSTIKKVIESYEKMYEEMSTRNFTEYFNLQGEDYNNLINALKQYSDYLTIVQEKTNRTNSETMLESLLGNEADLKKYESAISNLARYNNILNDVDANPTQRYVALQMLDEQNRVIDDLIQKYPALKDQAEGTMKEIGLSTSNLIADEQQLYDDFIKSLDETHKVALGNIDKLESAMASAIKGEGLSHDSAWELLKLDTDKLLKPVIDSAGKYHFELDDIVALKDSIIDKNRTLIEQDMQEAQLAKQRADSELQVLQMEMARVNTRIRNEASGNTRPTEELVRKQADLRQQIESLTKSSKAYGDEIERDSILIKEYNAHSGNLLNTEKMLQAQIDALKKSQEQLKTEISDLNTQADKMLKAQEMKIDGIVDGLEAESKELEDSKQLLEDQLDVLEEQKEELEEIVKNYETIANVVDSTISKQIDEIEENRQAIEDYYNNLINKLKEENSERADALDYAEKLAALENAKNNKVRVYGTGTGWTYKVDQDALVRAQRALEDADTNKAVSELEKERDKAISGFDEQIKAFEDYADEWKDTVEEIRNQEDERLTAEILGSDWREKITTKDIDVLKNYRSEYRNYNAQLKSITDNEIKNLKASIDAKNKEIETKKKQIQVWNDYKSSVQNAVKSIKDSLDGYDELLNNIMLDENSTYEQRQTNLNNFANKYSDIISQINRKNSELDTTTNKISNLNRQITELNNNPITIESNLSDAADEMAEFIDQYRDAIEAMRKRLDDTVSGYGVVNSAWDEKLAQAANAMRRMGSYSQGGSVAYTGLAQVHGSPNKSETVFNASQSKELWDMVRTGNFTNLVADKAIKGVSSVLNNNTSNLNNSRVININGMVIKADNPKQFHDQFMAEINKYWSVQLTESPIR